jgi:hypothetical protein
MRSIGVYRQSGSTNLASNTNSHDQTLASQREKTRQHVRENMVKEVWDYQHKFKKKSFTTLASSQRTSIVSSDLKPTTFYRSTYNGNLNKNVVKSALSRVRNSGCVPPKKNK